MMKTKNWKTLLTLWIVTIAFSLLALVTSAKHPRFKELKRGNLGFRPVHFAAVGLPLGDTPTSKNGGSKTGAFKIDDSGVVGAGVYEIGPDGVDIDLNLKISTNGQGKPGGGASGGPGAGGAPGAGGGAGGGPGAGGSPGAGGVSPTPPPPATKAPKPALCPVPCSQTKPTQGPGGSSQPGSPGAGGAGGVSPTPPPPATKAPKPALCPVPCSQTKPTQGPGGSSQPASPATSPRGGTGATTAPNLPTTGAGGPTTVAPTGNNLTPSQGPGGSGPQPTALPGAAATTAPPGAGGGGGSSFEQEGLQTHNKYRQVHGVPAMTLNAEMSASAAAYAQRIAQQGQLQHSSRGERNGDGENLSMGCDQDGQTAKEATTNWYNEVCDPGYTFGGASGSPGTGHFTQVVWKESTELGIGKYDIDKDGMKCTYIVGRYRKAGNMGGAYADNVPRGSFNEAQACSGVRRATILRHLAPRSRIHRGKSSKKT